MKAKSGLPYYLTISATEMRRVNRSAVLEYIRLHGPVAYSEIQAGLGLTIPTVSRLVEDLIAEGLVLPTGKLLGKAGRPPSQVEYNKHGGLVIGVDLGGQHLYGALASVGGEILAEETIPTQSNDGETNLTALLGLIQSLLTNAQSHTAPVLGIAIGATGLNDLPEGMVRDAPSLGWVNLPLRQILADRFPYPVVFENDVNLAALGELWFGCGRGVHDLVLLTIGRGLGAGLVIDGMLARGAHHNAGEAGHFFPAVGALGSGSGPYGAVGSLVSEPGMIRRAQALLARSGQPAPPLTDALEVFHYARAGAPWAQQTVEEIVSTLAFVIANISALLDPELVILQGPVTAETELLVEPLRRCLQNQTPRPVNLAVSPLGQRAAVMGAIPLILHVTRDLFMVRRMQ